MKKLLSLLLIIGIFTASPSHAVSGKEAMKNITAPILDATKSIATWMYRHPLAAMTLTNIPALLFVIASASSYQTCAKGVASYHDLHYCQEQFQNKIVVGGITYLGLNGLLYLHAITAPVIDGVTLTGQWIYKHPKLCLLTAAALMAAGATQDI